MPFFCSHSLEELDENFTRTSQMKVGEVVHAVVSLFTRWSLLSLLPRVSSKGENTGPTLAICFYACVMCLYQNLFEKYQWQKWVQKLDIYAAYIKLKAWK